MATSGSPRAQGALSRGAEEFVRECAQGVLGDPLWPLARSVPDQTTRDHYERRFVQQTLRAMTTPQVDLVLEELALGLVRLRASPSSIIVARVLRVVEAALLELIERFSPTETRDTVAGGAAPDLTMSIGGPMSMSQSTMGMPGFAMRDAYERAMARSPRGMRGGGGQGSGPGSLAGSVTMMGSGSSGSQLAHSVDMMRSFAMSDGAAEAVARLVQTLLEKSSSYPPAVQEVLRTGARACVLQLSFGHALVCWRLIEGLLTRDALRTDADFAVISSAHFPASELRALLALVTNRWKSWSRSLQDRYAGAVRAMSWHWIDAHRRQYETMHLAQQAPFEGYPMRLFDMLDELNSSATWPLQATLLVLSPAVVAATLDGTASPRTRGRGTYAVRLLHGLASKKASHHAVEAMVLVVRGAALSPPQCALQRLAVHQLTEGRDALPDVLDPKRTSPAAGELMAALFALEPPIGFHLVAQAVSLRRRAPQVALQGLRAIKVLAGRYGRRRSGTPNRFLQILTEHRSIQTGLNVLNEVLRESVGGYGQLVLAFEKAEREGKLSLSSDQDTGGSMAVSYKRRTVDPGGAARGTDADNAFLDVLADGKDGPGLLGGSGDTRGRMSMRPRATLQQSTDAMERTELPAPVWMSPRRAKQERVEKRLEQRSGGVSERLHNLIRSPRGRHKSKGSGDKDKDHHDNNNNNNNKNNNTYGAKSPDAGGGGGGKDDGKDKGAAAAAREEIAVSPRGLLSPRSSSGPDGDSASGGKERRRSSSVSGRESDAGDAPALSKKQAKARAEQLAALTVREDTVRAMLDLTHMAPELLISPLGPDDVELAVLVFAANAVQCAFYPTSREMQRSAVKAIGLFPAEHRLGAVWKTLQTRYGPVGSEAEAVMGESAAVTGDSSSSSVVDNNADDDLNLKKKKKTAAGRLAQTEERAGRRRSTRPEEVRAEGQRKISLNLQRLSSRDDDASSSSSSSSTSSSSSSKPASSAVAKRGKTASSAFWDMLYTLQRTFADELLGLMPTERPWPTVGDVHLIKAAWRFQTLLSRWLSDQLPSERPRLSSDGLDALQRMETALVLYTTHQHREVAYRAGMGLAAVVRQYELTVWPARERMPDAWRDFCSVRQVYHRVATLCTARMAQLWGTPGSLALPPPLDRHPGDPDPPSDDEGAEPVTLTASTQLRRTHADAVDDRLAQMGRVRTAARDAGLLAATRGREPPHAFTQLLDQTPEELAAAIRADPDAESRFLAAVAEEDKSSSSSSSSSKKKEPTLLGAGDFFPDEARALVRLLSPGETEFVHGRRYIGSVMRDYAAYELCDIARAFRGLPRVLASHPLMNVWAEARRHWQLLALALSNSAKVEWKALRKSVIADRMKSIDRTTAREFHVAARNAETAHRADMQRGGDQYRALSLFLAHLAVVFPRTAEARGTLGEHVQEMVAYSTQDNSRFSRAAADVCLEIVQFPPRAGFCQLFTLLMHFLNERMVTSITETGHGMPEMITQRCLLVLDRFVGTEGSLVYAETTVLRALEELLLNLLRFITTKSITNRPRDSLLRLRAEAVRLIQVLLAAPGHERLKGAFVGQLEEKSRRWGRRSRRPATTPQSAEDQAEDQAAAKLRAKAKAAEEAVGKGDLRAAAEAAMPSLVVKIESMMLNEVAPRKGSRGKAGGGVRDSVVEEMTQFARDRAGNGGGGEGDEDDEHVDDDVLSREERAVGAGSWKRSSQQRVTVRMSDAGSMDRAAVAGHGGIASHRGTEQGQRPNMAALLAADAAGGTTDSFPDPERAARAAERGSSAASPAQKRMSVAATGQPSPKPTVRHTVADGEDANEVRAMFAAEERAAAAMAGDDADDAEPPLDALLSPRVVVAREHRVKVQDGMMLRFGYLWRATRKAGQAMDMERGLLWRRCWFLLNGGRLMQYASKEDKQADLQVALTQCDSIRALAESTRPFTLLLETGGRELLLAAETAAERDEWIAAMCTNQMMAMAEDSSAGNRRSVG